MFRISASLVGFMMFWALKAARTPTQKVVALLPAPLFLLSSYVIPRFVPDVPGLIGVFVFHSLLFVAALALGSHYRTVAMRAALEE